MIKAAFFDIDGTLVSFKTHRIPDSTIQALNDLRREGVKLFIASGRHKLSMNNLGNQTFDGYVTLNGSLCLADDRVIYKHPLPGEDMQTLIAYLNKTEAFPCVFVQENYLSINYLDKTTRETFRLLNFPEPPACPLSEIEGKIIYQLLGFFPKAKETEIMSKLPGCRATRWNPLFTDIIPANSSKSVGISRILEYFGMTPEETIAFGDGGNDIEMLRHAGIGVAMGNAADEVKKAADYTTASVDENGIILALRQFGLI